MHRPLLASTNLKIFLSRALCCVALSCAALSAGLSPTNLWAQTAAAGNFKTPPGFVVDLVYQVPIDKQGSWVALCVDPKGRLLASDQYGKLYRLTLSPSDPAGQPGKIEQLEIDIGMAQGMYAFDNTLLINVNAQGPSGPGLYRLTDTDNNDQYDRIEHLIPVRGVGEHGVHAIIPGPDGKIYFCGGNQADVPDKVTSSVVPRHWSEDHILGRMPDGRGFMKDRLAPGGWICRMDRDGTNIELLATGFRNEYDIAFNPQGELFTYDADMEWDVGTPWYRPTRINHVISGAEFGWRNGTGKWPDYYPDSFGAVDNIGPGSPTGITFGTGAKFPAKYQQALLICDWSFGTIYAVSMQPSGSSYVGTHEAMVTASPMAVTDLVVHPTEGNLYFAVGGRKTLSALYRLRYTGEESTAPVQMEETAETVAARKLRHQLEVFHGRANEAAIEPALAQLGNADRAIRFAARIALEHQPVEKWREAALRLSQPQAIITAAVGLARMGAKGDQAQLISQLAAIDFAALPPATQLELLRAEELVCLRLGKPDESQRQALVSQLNAHFPTRHALVNRELANVLVYLQAPGIVERVVKQLRTASAQEDQIHYAFCLREVEQGWTPELRQKYFEWFFESASQRGGASFGGFLANIRTVALDKLDESARMALGELAGPLPAPKDPLSDLAPRQVVKKWSVDELEKAVAAVKEKPDFARGRELFAQAQCFKCHRFAGQGGIHGPDLTASGGRFSPHDLIVSMVDPNKEISDQYAATQFLTDTQVIEGRVANMNQNVIMVITNMLAPGDFTNIERDAVIEQRPSKNSMMPGGLLDTFQPAEVADIIAYLRSGGNADHAVYK